MDHTVRHETDDAPPSGSSDSRHKPSESNNPTVKLIAVVRPIAFDHLSDVRYLHSQSLKNLAGGELTDDEFAIAKAHVYSTKYVDALGAAIRRRQLYGSWIGEVLVGTAGWSTMEDASTVARIRSIFVSPLYTRLGLAQQMLAHVEAQATIAGFSTYSVRSMTNAAGFFVRQGYAITSHGVRILLPDRPVPVTFLRKSVGATV
jgi:GNAT superfamily N-acetyltransferase